MANKDNVSVSGDVTVIRGGKRLDVAVTNQGENWGGQGGVFADSNGGRGGHLTGIYRKESTQFEATTNGNNFGQRGAMIKVQHEGDKWGGHAAFCGDNNGSRGGELHGFYKNGNTQVGATFMGDNSGNKGGMLKYERRF